MRRIMVLLLASLLLVSVLGAVAPVWAKGGRHGRGRDRDVVVFVPRDVVVVRPHVIKVVRLVIVEDVILIPHREFRVIERGLDRFLIIVGGKNVLVILRS